jgi:geranylgeranyl pyrophosphate synthase
MATTVTSIDNSRGWLGQATKTRTRAAVAQQGTMELEAAFRSSMDLPSFLEPSFDGVLRHLLDHPGSMVRPRLVHQIALAYGLESQSAIDLAVALEYFHTSSLVFDDLPCMDNALSRRGAVCVHVPFGEAGAILGALALINRAYALTWKVLAGCAARVQSQAMEYVERLLGIEGLLNGQSLDLNYASLPHDRETTERIACGKTVSLIRLTLVLPAMLGGARPREVQYLERMASCWGLAYQIVDDLKDVLQSSAQSGKTSARDLHLNRPNIALAAGVPTAVERLTRLIDAGDRTLQNLLAVRPALSFLAQLRADLQNELSRVTDQVYVVSTHGKA